MPENLRLNPLKSILIIDDDPELLKSLKLSLLSFGFNNIICIEDSRKVFSTVNFDSISLILLDMFMPYVTGEEVLEQLQDKYPEIPVIMISGLNDVKAVVKCIKKGLADYIVKPVDKDTLIASINKVLEISEIRSENENLKKQLLTDSSDKNKAFSEIITKSNKMKYIFRYCEVISCSSQPILITGETGTGKELFAKAIYKLSRCTGEFVAANIAGFDDTLFSDTLFGHTKGAFTGATDIREGLIAKAHNGVLFLDEIGDLSLSSQVKLLRLLQEREYSPLGTDQTKRSNTKIVLATHKNLKKLINNETFRKDLYYRLSMHQFNIPPLRDRIDDIQLLLNKFLEDASKDLGIKTPSYHPELINLLCSYSFPGNIREFQSMIFEAVSKHKSHMLSTSIFKEHIGKNISDTNLDIDHSNADWVSGIEILPSLKEASEIIVNEALKRSNGNQRVASHLLGITPQALSKRLRTKKTK